MEIQQSGRKLSKDDVITELSIVNQNLISKIKALEGENAALRKKLFNEMSRSKLLERRLELAEDK